MRLVDLMREQRAAMVERDIASRGVTDPAVLKAMIDVPREEFVPPELVDRALADSPLPIGQGQTISQPYVVAAMAEALQLTPASSVLEVGAGSGYAAAVLARIAAAVYAIERHPPLAREAALRLQRLGVTNVHLTTGDGTLGWAEHAPYDAILVSAGGPEVPQALREQLSIGGRLVMPVGATHHMQSLVRLVRRGDSAWDREDLGAVTFVPLVGEQGWKAAER
jgi:protein-L-isoaspartate(D-aspartate) O-methyltransferase